MARKIHALILSETQHSVKTYPIPLQNMVSSGGKREVNIWNSAIKIMSSLRWNFL